MQMEMITEKVLRPLIEMQPSILTDELHIESPPLHDDLDTAADLAE